MFSNIHATLIKFDHILGHKENISNFHCVEILQITSDNDTPQLEVTNKNKQANKQRKISLPPGNEKYFYLTTHQCRENRLNLQNLSEKVMKAVYIRIYRIHLKQ